MGRLYLPFFCPTRQLWVRYDWQIFPFDIVGNRQDDLDSSRAALNRFARGDDNNRRVDARSGAITINVDGRTTSGSAITAA